MTTTVIHYRDAGPWPWPDNYVYIGRAMPRYKLPESKWANPYRIGPDGTRLEVLAEYDTALPEINGGRLLQSVGELKGKVLVCWCKPNPCHGDLLAALADAA